MKLWGGRFADANDPRVADFTRSIDVDQALALDDLEGSIAHVHGLGRAGLLSPQQVDALVAGLDGLKAEVESDTIEWDPSLEDVHLNLEVALPNGSVPGRPAPYGQVAQRPGRDRPSAVAAADDRSTRRGDRRARARARWTGRA